MATVKGLAQVQRNLKLALAKATEAGAAGWEKAAREVLAPASQALVPVGETGNLKRSIVVERHGTTTTVGYTAPYALFVHEDLEARHDNGQAKFLETPAREKAPQMLAVIAAEVRKAVAR